MQGRRLSAEIERRGTCASEERSGLDEAGRQGPGRTARPRSRRRLCQRVPGGRKQPAGGVSRRKQSNVCRQRVSRAGGPHAGARRVPPGDAAILARVSKSCRTAHDVFHLLAGGGVRAQADDSHQPRGDSGKPRGDDRGVEAVIFKSLLLDRPRAAGVDTRSFARRRLLVRDGQPQPVGRSHRFRRPNYQREGAGGRA